MSEEVKGPTVVLIGGALTLDSGERLDSRQPIEGDQWDFTLRSALGRSELWWEAARKLVDVLLDKDRSDGAWALAWAPKTLWQPKQDGSARRTRIRTALPGSVSLMDLWRDQEGGDGNTIDASKTTARYRVLEHPLRYRDLAASRPPTVFFGVHPTEWWAEGLDPFDAILEKWPDIVLVLPHTPLVEATIAKVRSWFSEGGKPRIPFDKEPWQEKMGAEFSESMMAFRDHKPVVLDADFRVTHFLDCGLPRSAADLEAALTFVLSRYDLDIGLWDLARDPGLRESLLSPEELEALHSHPIVVPEKLRAAAAKTKSARKKQRSSESVARRRIHGSLEHLLARIIRKGSDFGSQDGVIVSRTKDRTLPLSSAGHVGRKIGRMARCERPAGQLRRGRSREAR